MSTEHSSKGEGRWEKFDAVRIELIRLLHLSNVTSHHGQVPFIRHLRIAMGSAAEAECLTRLAAEVRYLPAETTDEIQRLLERAMAALTGLIRKIPLRT